MKISISFFYLNFKIFLSIVFILGALLSNLWAAEEGEQIGVPIKITPLQMHKLIEITEQSSYDVLETAQSVAEFFFRNNIPHPYSDIGVINDIISNIDQGREVNREQYLRRAFLWEPIPLEEIERIRQEHETEKRLISEMAEMNLLPLVAHQYVHEVLLSKDEKTLSPLERRAIAFEEQIREGDSSLRSKQSFVKIIRCLVRKNAEVSDNFPPSMQQDLEEKKLKADALKRHYASRLLQKDDRQNARLRRVS